MKKLIILAIIAVSCSTPKHDLIITNVNVIDVVTGEVLPNRSVAIDGDSITAIYTETIKPGKQTEVVDGTGKYLIPGLWDMHAHHHWFARDADLLMIPNGVLAVRDPWGDPGLAKKLRNEHLEGTLDGVDIFTSGSLIDGSPSMFNSSEVSSEEEARAIVRCQAAEGVDFVKPYSGLSKEAYLALADEARKQGVMVAGHVPNSVILEEAIAAGQRIDDHVFGVETLYHTPEQWDTIYQLASQKLYEEATAYWKKHKDSALALSKLQGLKDKDIWFCPTYVTLYGVNRIYKEKMEADPRNEFVSVTEKYDVGEAHDTWADNRFYKRNEPDSLVFKREAEYIEETEENIRMLIQAGTKLLAGTDYDIPYVYAGSSLQEELQVFVRLGMTPLQALQTATINPAQFMMNDKVGEVKAGKKANLLLLNANPLEDIQHAQDIQAVVLRGKHLDRKSLDGMLAKAKQLANAKHIHEWFAPRFEKDGIDATIQEFMANQETIDEGYPIRWNMLISAARKFLKADKKQEAFAMVKLTQDLNPDFVYAFAYTGDIYATGGEKELARATYQKALEIYPCFTIVERWIKELDKPLAFGQEFKMKEPVAVGAFSSCVHEHRKYQ
jgi:tetratricopeptide (TPR) repeat protein